MRPLNSSCRIVYEWWNGEWWVWTFIWDKPVNFSRAIKKLPEPVR